MINKKVIVGILAVLVILTAIQGLKPVLADDDLDPSNGSGPLYFVVVTVNGQGTVSWSGDLSGSTNTYAFLSVPDGSTITFTANGGSLSVDSSSISGAAYTLSGWAPPSLTDHVITANFD